MKKYIAILVILACFTPLIYFMFFYATVTLDGTVFTLEDGDTVLLDSVNVELAIVDPTVRNEEGEVVGGGIDFSKVYFAKTDSNGYYSIDIGFVPYQANYTITFRNYYFVTAVYRKTSWRSADQTMDVALKKLMPNGSKREVFGEFNFIESQRNKELFYVIFSGFLLMLITVITIKYSLFQRLFDAIRRLRKTNFSNLQDDEQQSLLNQTACDKCSAEQGFVYEGEESVHGIIMVHARCKNCGNKIKVRWQ